VQMGMARLLPALLIGLGVLLAGCATPTKIMEMGQIDREPRLGRKLRDAG